MKKFPLSPCYKCKRKITDEKEGFISAHNYTNFLRKLLNDYTPGELVNNGENSKFVNSLTEQYFSQHKELEKQSSHLTLFDYLTDKLIEEKAVKYRLEKVMEKCPNKYLFMLVHDECHPKEIEPYYIDLPRINTAEKALDWTFHLAEKTWFNPLGWIQVMEDLFGRNGI